MDINSLVRKIIPNKNISRIVVTTGTLVVSSGTLGLLVFQQRDALLEHKWQIKIGPLAISFILFTIAFLFAVYMWSVIMQDLGIKIRYWKHFQHYSVANLAKRIPGTVWYIASRSNLYREQGIPWQQTTLVSGVEVAVTLVSGIIVGIFFGFSIIQQYKVSLWALILPIGGSIAIFHPKMIRWLFLRFGVDATAFQYKNLIKWIIGYMLIWILGGIILYTIGNIFWAIPVKLIGYVIGSWVIVGIASNILFFSPSNLGITEVGLSLLLSRIMPSPIAVLISISARILLFLYDIIWALIALRLVPL